jgi:hypothetical protein
MILFLLLTVKLSFGECLRISEIMKEKDRTESVLYYSEELQKYNALSFESGSLILHGLPLTTGPLGFIYVLDINHKFIVSVGKQGYVNHGTLASGDGVYAAGRIFALNGELIAIDNHSGHYRPKLEHILYLLTFLKDKGIDTEHVIVKNYEGM